MQKGFSTLFIVIILGSIALSVSIAMSTSSLWSVQGSISKKQETIARSTATACAEVALEMMRQNNNFSGSNSVTLDSNGCDYTVTNLGGDSRNISVTSTINGATRKLEIITDSFNPLNIVSWQEIS